jgi:hypothetical protein
MSFFAPDEHFILMDKNQANFWEQPPALEGYISEDDLRMLYDCGIRTAYMFDMKWNSIETSKGVYDWHYADDYVERATRLGYKVLIPSSTYIPQWFPDDWYLWDASGKPFDHHDVAPDTKHAISPWNSEAREYELRFLELLHHRYLATNVLVINSYTLAGETLLPNELACYDPHALASFHAMYGNGEMPANDGRTAAWLKSTYIALLLAQQSILVDTPSREIFTMLHPQLVEFHRPFSNGCDWIADILEQYNSIVKPSVINHIYYTYTMWTNKHQLMCEWAATYHEQVWGGAEYCEGLPMTTPQAIKNGNRGQILAPCYPGIHEKIEPWMINNLKVAAAQWQASEVMV